MCVAIACLGSSTPSRVQLERGCVVNPDGFGWVVVFQGTHGLELEQHRTMNADDAINGYLGRVKALGDRVQVSGFHARITTHGASVLENCHPWPVNETTAVIHNGVLPVDMAAAAGRSDSGVWAQDLFPLLGGVSLLDTVHGFDVLEASIGSGSKVCIFTADPAAEFCLYILGESRGEWVGDVWYSNDSCEPRVYAWEKWDKWPATTTAASSTSAALFYEGDLLEDLSVDAFAAASAAIADGEAWVCKVCEAINTDSWEDCSTCSTCRYCYGLVPSGSECSQCWSFEGVRS